MRIVSVLLQFVLIFSGISLPVYYLAGEEIIEDIKINKSSQLVEFNPSELTLNTVMTKEDLSLLYFDVLASCRNVASHNCYKGYYNGEIFTLEVDMYNKLTAYSYKGNYQHLRDSTENSLGDIVLQEDVPKEQLTNNGQYGFVVDILDKEGVAYEVYYFRIKGNEYLLRFENNLLVSVEKA